MRTKNRGFSDRLYWLNFRMVWIYTYICVLLSILGNYINIGDYSFVSVGLPLIWAELGFHTTFILRKAWLENLNKHKLVDRDNVGGL